MSTERLPSDAFRVKRKPPYVDVAGLLPIFEKVAFISNLVLVGPKGIGKSMALAYYASDKNHHLVTFDCSEDVRRSHLIGTYTLRGDETPFVLGALTTAYEVANETGHCILVLEEINALSPQMQKTLNSSTDFRKRIEVPEARTIFELKKDAKLWVCGTMNTANYGGVYSLNEDLKSRMRMVPLSYPTNEADIVSSEMKSRNIQVAPEIVTKVLALAVQTRQMSVEYALSPRDVVQIVEDISLVGVKDGLWLASGKFEDADRKFFTDRVWDGFNVVLPGSTAPVTSPSAAAAVRVP